MSAAQFQPVQNQILSALPGEEFDRLAFSLERIELPTNTIIHNSHEHISHLYFPECGMVSMVSNMSSGQTVEVGVVGREGVSGFHTLLGVSSTPNESMIQLKGAALRIKTDVLKAEFKRGGALQDSLLRYFHGLIIQVSQTAACNRLHLVEERFARWLLMCHDRADSDELALTHEFISMMLGTRRAGITGAALALQAEGLIRYKHGHVTILNRQGLENFSCECYQIVKAEFDRISNQ